MKKVKHILATFTHSFIPQDIYYPKLLRTRLQFSLKYYAVIVSFFALIFTGIVVCQLSPFKMVRYKNAITKSLNAFPKEVKLTIKRGVLESNLNQPLFLWVYDGSQPLFMFMIHTKDILVATHIPQPLVFLGQDMAQISYRGRTLVRPYSDTWNIAITKDTIQSFIAHVDSYFLLFALFFYLFLVILVPLFFIVISTLLILLSSTLVYMLLYTFIPHIHLKKCIQASMHGTHIPLFVVVLLFSLFPSAINILTIATSLIFVFTLVSTYEMYSKGAFHFKGR